MTIFVGGINGDVAAGETLGNMRLLGNFDWGQKIPTAKSYALAKAILTECGLPSWKVSKFYVRFMHRMGLSKGEMWRRDTKDWLEIVATIERVEEESKADVKAMAREMPRVVGAGGIGEWGGTHAGSNQAPVLVPNDPKKARK